jgi:hypothetical protein
VKFCGIIRGPQGPHFTTTGHWLSAEELAVLRQFSYGALFILNQSPSRALLNDSRVEIVNQ